MVYKSLLSLVIIMMLQVGCSNPALNRKETGFKGINQLTEAFVKPINVTSDYIDRIAQGDIPEKITEEYVEEHLRLGIDALNELINHGLTVKHLKF